MTSTYGSNDLTALLEAVQGFRPDRLELAREAMNLETKELAERVGTTPSAISQLEHGKTKPKTETLLRLALALGVPPQFFAAPEPPTMSAERCHFRRRRGTPKREQRYVLARGRLVREVVRYLEEWVHFPQEELSALQRPVDRQEDIERLALEVRDLWGLGLGPIQNVVKLLELHGAIPVEVQGHSERLDAFSTWADGRPMVFLSVDKACASRRRFDAAHELGHLLMHQHCEAGDPATEREADAFASAFLMPDAPFRADCPSRLSWPALRDVKRRWGTSLLAAVRRAHDLGIYSEATYRRAHVQYAQHGWRDHGEPDEPPMERPQLVAEAVHMLEEAGHPLSVTAKGLSYSLKLLEETIWPQGRAA